MQNSQERPPPATGRQSPEYLSAQWKIDSLVALLSLAVTLPFLRVVMSLSDEGILPHAAERILDGQRIYHDFFEFLPPGGFLLTAGWLHLLGRSLISIRALEIITIVLISVFTVRACRGAGGSIASTLLLTSAWIVMSQGPFTQLSHHWLTSCFAMIAAWSAISAVATSRSGDQTSLRWVYPACSGLAAGAAGMITPTCGLLAALASLVCMILTASGAAGGRLPTANTMCLAVIPFAAGLLGIPLCMIAYLGWNGVLVEAFHDVIIFPAHRYAPVELLSYGSFAWTQTSLLVAAFPLAGLALAALLWRTLQFPHSARSQPLHPVAATSSFAIAGFIGCFPRADVFHIAFVVPLALPLLALGMTRLAESRTPRERVFLAAIFLVICAPAANSYYLEARDAYRTPGTPTARGTAYFRQLPGAPELFAALSKVPENDVVFTYPFLPLVGFLSDHPDAGRYDVFTPVGYATPRQYREACEAAIHLAKWAVFDSEAMSMQWLQGMFPALPARPFPEALTFERALRENFKTISASGNYELLQRRAITGVDSCHEIDDASPPAAWE